MSEGLKTVVLGNEYDQALRDALSTVLKRSGAISVDKSWGVGGSQEVETAKVKLGEDMITIESETFIGLTITGPSHIVESLMQEVHDQLAKPKLSTGSNLPS